ncbi:MAG: 50S ribosomal protein L3 N(5)-glutamine methyltransferase [Pseudomonadales bacterium]
MSLTKNQPNFPLDELHTLRDYIRWTASYFNQAKVFFGHGTDNAWDEAVLLVFGCLHLPWDTDHTAMDARLTRQEKENICRVVVRRVNERIPLAYLTNEAWFAGLPFYVDERVLIPRSPIAELIERGFTPWLCGDEVHQILDLCTGSGCIGIACAMAFPESEVDLSDVSEDALAVAGINIRNHHLEKRVSLYQSNLFNELPLKGYDLIVSNPPYVDAQDFADMPEEYKHEPQLGLSAGADGLDCIREILRKAGDYLTEYGVLVAEVGNSEAALRKACEGVPFLWLDFERGGHGVFVLTAAQLKQYKSLF